MASPQADGQANPGDQASSFSKQSPRATHKSDPMRRPATVDSDSGHGRASTSSSAASSSSSDPSDHQDELDDLDEPDLQRDDPPLEGADHSMGAPESASPKAAEAAPLKVRLDETTEILRLALGNEFNRALGICGQRAHEELYASLAHATLSFLRAALTLEQADLQSALASIQQSFEVSSRRRRPRPRPTSAMAMMVARLLYRPTGPTGLDYNRDYTDDEIHAELVHAESLLLLALISFLADQSLICLVRGAFRIRACHQRYKECQHIMATRTRWQCAASRRHFESGVRMGHGIFNLLMSYLPRRVLRFLEYVGFSGNRSVGIDELDRSVALADGLRSVFSALVILTYHSYVENLFGLGHYDDARVEQLNASLLAHYPNSAFFLLFLGRYRQMRGQLAAAIASFEACIAAQSDWRQFHSICHWEMMWCHAVQLDWPRAAHYSDLLRRHSKWSPASYTYQYATFLYAQLVEERRSGRLGGGGGEAAAEAAEAEYQRRLAEIRDIMASVPQLRIRYCGKTIPAEKFAITRAERFCRQGDRLTLPALEFLYVWNVFCTLRDSPQQVERLLGRIDSEIGHIESEMVGHKQESGSEGHQEEAAAHADDLCLALLLRGMCLKHLGRFEEAEASFMSVIRRSGDICADTFLVPHTEMELAILSLQLGRHEVARNWIKSARQNYTGYLLETIVHFRLHAASRLLRQATAEQSAEQPSGHSGSCCESPALERN